MKKILFLLLILILIFIYSKYCSKEAFENNNWFNDNIDLYFINMDISKDRRENMEKQFVDWVQMQRQL